MSLFLIIQFTGLAQDTSVILNGKWEDKKYQVSYEFQEDGTIFFNQMGYGVLVNMYSIDWSKDPGWMLMTMKMGGNSVEIPALIRKVDENTLWIEQLTPGTEYRSEITDPNETGMQVVHVLKKE